ncbi:hypothetical protein F4823DRAFT_560279 [Ustulina deusta]|nr:hypothetical protein F4823DRAFT_560279 [Ustulina deusta]
MCNGKSLVIHLFAESFDESPPLKDPYLFFPRVTNEFEIDGLPVDDFYDWVLEPFFPILRDLPTLKGGAVSTLQDFFFPETRFFTLRAVTGRLVPVPSITDKADNGGLGYGIHLPDAPYLPW